MVIFSVHLPFHSNILDSCSGNAEGNDGISNNHSLYYRWSCSFQYRYIVNYLTLDKEKRREFWIRSFNFKRIKLPWYGLIFGLNILPSLIVIIIGVILNKQGTNFFEAVDFFTSLTILVTFTFNLAAVLFEEFGWRGYALDGLHEKMNKFVTSLILGVFWFVWHFPLFFIVGSYQNGLGFGSLDFWMFGIGILAQTIIMTWIYFRTNRSILSALLFHFLTNFLGEMFEFDQILQIIRTMIYLVIALIISIYWGVIYFKHRRSNRLS